MTCSGSVCVEMGGEEEERRRRGGEKEGRRRGGGEEERRRVTIRSSVLQCLLRPVTHCGLVLGALLTPAVESLLAANAVL